MRNIYLCRPFIMFLAIVCTGCSSGINIDFKGGTQGVLDTRTTVVDHVQDAAVQVESVNGGIKVTQSDRGDVQVIAHVKARTQERLDATTVSVTRDELNNLRVGVEWPEGRKNNEGCSFEIELPDASNVNLRSSNGKITLVGLSGTATLKTSNRSVRVEGFEGDVKADTSNGSVKIRDVEGLIDADTKNGSIEITEAKHQVIADTSNGSVHVKLADDDSAGPVEIDTSNGSVTLELNSAFTGQLSCRTSNAKIRLNGLSGQVVDDGKRSKKIQFGDSMVESRIKTSNGSISVTQRD